VGSLILKRDGEGAMKFIKTLFLILISTLLLIILKSITASPSIIKHFTTPDSILAVNLCWSSMIALWNGLAWGIVLRRHGVYLSILPIFIYFFLISLLLKSIKFFFIDLEFFIMMFLSIWSALLVNLVNKSGNPHEESDDLIRR
jgi:hypothetical protein